MIHANLGVAGGVGFDGRLGAAADQQDSAGAVLFEQGREGLLWCGGLM